jgi:hypothetical protein
MPDYIGSVHAMLVTGLPMSVAETRSFSAQVKGVLTEDEIADLKVDLALRPTAGVVMEGTGGIRKYRVACRGRGKRGGARVIYYYHDRDMPIYLLAIYSKSEKIDLSDTEKAIMRKFVEQLVKKHRIRNLPKMIS